MELATGNHWIERGRFAIRSTRDRILAGASCYLVLIFYSWWAVMQIVRARAPIGEFSHSGMIGNLLAGLGCLLSVVGIWLLSRNHWAFRLPIYAALLFWLCLSYFVWSCYWFDWRYFKR